MDSKGQIYDGEKETIPEGSFSIMPEEQRLLYNVPADQRVDTLINLRFKAWLAYNNLKPDVVTKMKMKQAFRAGFYARSLST
jgi:hypothetical protein